MEINKRQAIILNNLSVKDWLNRSQLLLKLQEAEEEVSLMTINRDLSYLLELGFIEKEGQAKATKYKLTNKYNLLKEIDPQKYFERDIEKRSILERFNFDIFNTLKGDILTDKEKALLEELNNRFLRNYNLLSKTIQKREWERAIIDLSWKSSALEGNTYTLLETETLIREGIEATGKKKEEAIMILNHKKALEFINENKNELRELNIKKIEQLHSILIDNLEITKNIRNTLVGITGTNYKPLDNSYQIKEALEEFCKLINSKVNTFEKALITLPLIGYIQPFEDGNKRTGRILANGLLLANNSFPITLRNLDINEYKEAMLIFYEINNISLMKKIFLKQSQFAVENYFLTSLYVKLADIIINDNKATETEKQIARLTITNGNPTREQSHVLDHYAKNNNLLFTDQVNK